MSYMLASVNSLEEALLVKRFNADIIDLKQPAQGALGALAAATVADIAVRLKPRVQISATIGDLPMQPGIVSQAVLEMAATGVDYIKIGFFPGGDWQGVIKGLFAIARQGHALIAVLFADTRPDFEIIKTLKRAGLRGVMLDTLHKQQGSLTQLMTSAQLQEFIDLSHESALLCGLAGSLCISDIEKLVPLNADYLGFRGALCRNGCRTDQLDEQQIAEIRRLIAP